MMTCQECKHSCDTTGWTVQLVNGCYCRVKREHVRKTDKCDAISALMFEDFIKANNQS